MCSVIGSLSLSKAGPLVKPEYTRYLKRNSVRGPELKRYSGLYLSGLLHTGKTQRVVEREVGGGIGMGNTCISMADSCQCMTKTTTIL